MRKLLGLLVAAVFVVTAASSAMAVTLSSSGATTQNFRAEVFFFQTGTAEFGFDLFRLADGAVKPGTSDATTPEIDWAGVSITAGQENNAQPAVASRVYAKIVNKAFTAKTKVLFYTDNTGSKTALGTGAYKYDIIPAAPAYELGSPQTINALVEKNGATGLNTSAGHTTLPLAYRLEVSSRVDAGTYNVATANFSDDLDPSPTLGQSGGALRYVTDLAKTAKPAGTGDPATNAYDEEYATISKTSGMFEWEDYTNASEENFYMFFASNFTRAFNGMSYGTDSLTVELVVEP